MCADITGMNPNVMFEIGETCKKLHIPVPGPGYWNKKAASRPVHDKPPLPRVLGLIGQTGLANPSATGTSSGSIAISGRLLARFNRAELFEKVWTMPLQRVAEGYKVSRFVIGEACRSLHIPCPGEGYWQKRAANKPVAAKPPLPKILDPIRQAGRVAPVDRNSVCEVDHPRCSQNADLSPDHIREKDLDDISTQHDASTKVVAKTRHGSTPS